MDLRRIYETALYGRPVTELARFYRETLGLRQVSELADAGFAFRLADGGILLLFDPVVVSDPNRGQMPHGATGRGHVAFGVPAGTLGTWTETLEERGVTIIREIEWDRDARSIYVHDPAGNIVELVDGDLWPP